MQGTFGQVERLPGAGDGPAPGKVAGGCVGVPARRRLGADADGADRVERQRRFHDCAVHKARGEHMEKEAFQVEPARHPSGRDGARR